MAMNEEIKSQHEENLNLINMTITEQAARLEGQIKIQELQNKLEAIKEQGKADSQKAEAETRSIIAGLEAETCQIISDSDKHVMLNKADVDERKNDLNHKAKRHTLEEKANMKELGLTEEDLHPQIDKKEKSASKQ